MKILVIAALKEEIQPFLSEHNFIEKENSSYHMWSKNSITVVSPKAIGKTLACYVLTTEIHRSKPDMVINIGTAGGINGEVELLKAYEIVKFRHVDITVPQFFSTDHLGTNNPSMTKLESRGIGTSESFNLHEKDVSVMKEYGLSVRDMESASLASICKIEKIKFVCIKVITDFLTFDQAISSESFANNFESASYLINETLTDFINETDGYVLKDESLYEMINNAKDNLQGFKSILDILRKPHIPCSESDTFTFAMGTASKRIGSLIERLDNALKDLTSHKLVSDEDIKKAWGNANFGESKRLTIKRGLLELACGHYISHTTTAVLIDLNLVKPDRKTITEKGKDYLYNAYKGYENGKGD